MGAQNAATIQFESQRRDIYIPRSRYCKTKQYLDATDAQITSWKSIARNNVEVHTC